MREKSVLDHGAEKSRKPYGDLFSGPSAELIGVTTPSPGERAADNDLSRGAPATDFVVPKRGRSR